VVLTLSVDDEFSVVYEANDEDVIIASAPHLFTGP